MSHRLPGLVRRLFSTSRPPTPAFRPTLERLEDRLTPSVAFATQVTFAAGNAPASAAVGDFNGDGKPDLAAANGLSGTVSVLLDATPAGATAPTFASQATFAAGSAPISVAVGDFNGDGKPDLAVANANSDTVSVLLNTTAAGAVAPTFAAQATFAVGHQPISVAVGDFNGDGKPDLAVVNREDNMVSILLNTTPAGAVTPSFAGQVPFAVGANPAAVAAGDFNGDGKPDLAVANENSDTVSVLLNTTAAGAAAPAFASQATFAVGANPAAVAAGDFNGDGKPDLAAANANSDTVSVLLNTTAAGATAPSFAGQVTFAAGAAPAAVAAGDFNGDGKPDLAVANENGSTVSVLVNTTPAGAVAPVFAAQATFAAGVNPFAVAAGDFNGDGKPDLTVANEVGGSGTVSVLLDTTTPFTHLVPVLVADQPGQGLVQYNQTTGQWVQLNPGNATDASLLAISASGYVALDYPGYGVFRYSPFTGAFTMVNGHDAEALAVDAAGDVFVSIAGAGVGKFPLSGGGALIASDAASMLSANAEGDLVGEFPGRGVFRRTAFTGVWVNINGIDAAAVAIDGAGDAFASFNGFGLGEFRRDGTNLALSSSAASALAADDAGDLTASIPQKGVLEFRPFRAGQSPNVGSLASPLAMDPDGNIYGEFPGYGVWEFNQTQGGWRQINAADVSLLAGA